MGPRDVRAHIEDDISSFFYVAPDRTTTFGVPWSEERVEAELDALRQALVEPNLALVRVDDLRTARSQWPVRPLWIVTRPDQNGYLVVFDPDVRRFGLATSNGQETETVNIWGDLVSTFMAR